MSIYTTIVIDKTIKEKYGIPEGELQTKNSDYPVIITSTGKLKVDYPDITEIVFYTESQQFKATFVNDILQNIKEEKPIWLQ